MGGLWRGSLEWGSYLVAAEDSAGSLNQKTAQNLIGQAIIIELLAI